MTPQAPAWEVAPGVHGIGPWGRTQTIVYLVQAGDSWVLVDAGWPNDAARIERAAAALFGPASRPAGILLTHCHPDHEGAARQLAHTWGCPVSVHPAELPIATRDFAAMVASAMPLDRWLILPAMRAIGRRRREAIFARATLADVVRPLDPAGAVPGLPGWTCLPTPGHTRGHVSFFRPADRVLIRGDAVVTVRLGTIRQVLRPRPGLSGPPWYTTWDRSAAAESIRRLAQLDPAVLAGGHGWPLTGGDTAERLRAFAGLPTRN